MIVTLKDITTKITKGTTPTSIGCKFEKSGINFIKSESLVDGKTIDKSKFAFISERTHERLKRSQIEKNDILFSMAGMFLGKTGIATAEVVPANTNQAVAIIRVDDTKANYEYVYYYLNQKSVIHTINTTSAQSAQPNINLKQIGEIKINLPDRKKQDQIVSLLSAIDLKISNNVEINDNLEQQAATYFQELFINNANPMWQISTISDLGTVVGGSTPSKTKPEYYTNNGIAWITPKDLSINKSKFISHGENDITELGLKNSSATVMPKDTVLFSSRAPIGYIAIASNEVTTNQGFKSVIPYSEIGTAFVYFFLKHSLPVIESAASGSTFKEISGSAMKNIPAIIPDRNTLDQFNSFCAPIFAQQKILEEQNHSLAMLRDSLLPKLMSGAIDIASIQL
ncbi:MAG: restriction endonuclease subunit S [Enterococcus sp.]|nr:restriction endonuclease subunit S [Enterococcus sp.]